jgi:primosomal protein N' (replication factor Y)
MVEMDDMHTHRRTLFVEVLLPLPLPGTYTYRVPTEWNDHIEVGKRVVVAFGAKKLYSAMVYRITHQPPLRYEAKYLLSVLDDKPILYPAQFKFWEWIADYYVCHMGEVMQAALPSALKLASETKIIAFPEGNQDRSHLSDKAFLILDALDIKPELTVREITQLLDQKTVFPLLNQLFAEGYIQLAEEVTPAYKPKTRSFVRLSDDFKDKESQKLLVEALHSAPKQQDTLIAYLQLSRNQDPWIGKKEIMDMAGTSSAVLQSLIQKGIFALEERAVSRIGHLDVELQAISGLSAVQQTALESIQSSFEKQAVTLLHGVTSSGKTEIYIKLIEQAIQKGKQVLYLLPEIALTAQITERLKLHFGKQLGVYHSRFNEQERVEWWNKTLAGDLQIVVGARSSVFLPFQQLGLIIVDEEHEPSYKQTEPAPRYHARDSAIYLAHLYQANVLLGSATPSLESYYNAKSGKFGLVELKERYGQSELPQMEIIDLKEQGRQEQVFGGYFSKPLLTAMQEALNQKKQVILFQNRRGHTPVVQCGTCGEVIKCIHCDVSLTFHKHSQYLLCHYCGYYEKQRLHCPGCGSAHLQSKGFGTERVEEELQLLMPQCRIGRLDFDSTRGKHGFQRILAAFDEHQFDVLIGTQMVAKGLDFGNVSVIGIIQADSLLFYPDFRAFERAYSLLTQVAGRAGRRDDPGRVIIQTNTPTHRVFEQVVQHDYEGMFMTEMTERKEFHYPPFYRMIQIEVRHTLPEVSKLAAETLTRALIPVLGNRIIGPQQPPISRVRNQYLYNLMIKLERVGIDPQKVKEHIKEVIHFLHADKALKGTRFVVDVDPF